MLLLHVDQNADLVQFVFADESTLIVVIVGYSYSYISSARSVGIFTFTFTFAFRLHRLCNVD